MIRSLNNSWKTGVSLLVKGHNKFQNGRKNNTLIRANSGPGEADRYVNIYGTLSDLNCIVDFQSRKKCYRYLKIGPKVVPIFRTFCLHWNVISTSFQEWWNVCFLWKTFNTKSQDMIFMQPRDEGNFIHPWLYWLYWLQISPKNVL